MVRLAEDWPRLGSTGGCRHVNKGGDFFIPGGDDDCEESIVLAFCIPGGAMRELFSMFAL